MAPRIFIKSFFAARNLPGELHSFPFQNFEQARNAALDCAYASPLAYDYLLFADADMELVVEDRGFRDRLEAPGYRLLQRPDSGLAYWNTRLVRRDVGARYHGVTHEYLDVPGGVQELRGVWYKDHASGSNRVDKFERDIRLLREALEKEPDNHRYWFYLAQSYRDAGRTARGSASLRQAGRDGRLGRGSLERPAAGGALPAQAGRRGRLPALGARRLQPAPAARRAALRSGALLPREGHERCQRAVLRAGLAMKRPEEDILFLEDFVYTAGLKEEYLDRGELFARPRHARIAALPPATGSR